MSVHNGFREGDGVAVPSQCILSGLSTPEASLWPCIIAASAVFVETRQILSFLKDLYMDFLIHSA